MLTGKFWGTGAAEGVPAPFCRCDVCEQARKLGGESRRLRSCFRLSDKIMLDLGADAVVQSIQYGAITDIEHVLVTHTHDDHLNPHMLMEAMWSKAYRKTLHYYFTEDSFEIVRHWRENPWILKGKVPEWEKEGIIAFHQLRFGETYQIDGIRVTPFRGNHKGNVEPCSAMYLVKLPDGRSLFYGLDSGEYFPETIEGLSHEKIDLFISECAVGVRDLHHPNHMNLGDVRKLIDTLYRQGTLHDNSTVYLTHINHGSSHAQMVKRTEELQFPVKTVVAYDGLKIL